MEIRVLDVLHKDVYVIFEVSLVALEKIKLALDMSTINFDGSKPEEAEAANFLTNDFYSVIEEIIDKIKGRQNGN
jgi:hypothetical protein